MDLGLRGAKVLVTAASQGLGAATARQFSREGAQVVISSRTLSDLQETASAINAETGNPVYTVQGDVSDDISNQRLIRNAAETLNGLDILVLNAGGPPAGSFEDFDLAGWQDAIQLTLLSAISLTRHALPYLKRSGRASILAVVSVAARQPVHNLTLSNTLRPAVVGLTKTLSDELASSNIRVNSILPGLTETARISNLMQARAEKNQTSQEDERKFSTADIPMGRFGRPEEFANAAVFLASPAASFITGIALAVDGGHIRATL
ncbi:MAG: SDR family oxidoreductase [Anaerolineae bacterium]|nr:SDR family oxidoreductase [Anaerolineae bacterium]